MPSRKTDMAKAAEKPPAEETRQLLHELRVHQNELETQKEELRAKQAELDAARARYFDLYDLAPVGYCTLTEKGLIREINLTATNLLGLSRAELVNQPIARFIHNADQDIFYRYCRQLLAAGDPLAFELRMVKKDGASFWANLTAAAALEESGGRVFLIVITDITERKRFEEAIRESEARFRLLYEKAPLGYQSLDENGCFIQVNQMWLDTLGYLREEVIGKSFSDFLHPDWRDHFKENFPRFKSIGEVLGVEFEMVKKNGGFILVSFNGKIGKDKNGNFQQTHCIFHDITERRRAEEALSEKTCILESIFESAPFIMMLVNEEGRVTNINRTGVRFTGRSRDELLGLLGGEVFGCLNSFDGQGCGKNDLCEFCPVRSRVMHTFQTGEPVYEGSGRLDVKSGDAVIKLDILVSTTLITSAEGRQVLVVITDITDRVRTEEKLRVSEARLRQAQKMESVGSLAGGIAHDLNNILFPISGLSEMLLEEFPPDTPAYESIEQIHKSAQRGSELVKQILAFSRQSSPKKLPIRIQSVLKETVKLARATIPMNIAITSHIGADCGLVSADPTQVHQIVMNLITNAHHAVEENGGTIHVALKAAAGGWNSSRMHPRTFGETDVSPDHAMPGDLLADRYACISISDTGIGMDQALMDKIFDPYFTTKKLGKGTGLGLSVVHGIVKEHGGDIRVYSEPGKGTAFHVYLPLLEDAKDGMAAVLARKHPTGSESILLVDDEEPIVRMEQMMLERLGYRVTVRTNSPDALAAFRADPSSFDLVISDRGMPNLTGEQLAVELNSIRPGIPIILCTGFSDEADVQRARAMGIKGFLMKPVATGDLAEMVRNVLDAVSDPECM